MANLYTIEIMDAQFNVDFPEDFFEIDKVYYEPPNMGQLPDAEPIPETPAPDTNKLLLCGPNSLLHLCGLLNVDANIDELKKLSEFDPENGTTMKGLEAAATYKGLAPKGVESSLELLKGNKVSLPAIAHINTNHFVVFESVDRDGVKISDSVQKDKTHITWDELSGIWRGELLVFDIKQGVKQEPAPLAFSDAPVYNFGKILAGKEVKHTFTIKNVGQKPLNILGITDT
jgi:predicted double-glycine peptidase